MGVAEGVAVGIVLAVIFGLLWVQRRVTDFKIETRRAWNDYWLWSYEAGNQRYEEFQRGKRVHLERRTFATEEHLVEAEQLMDRYAGEQKVRMRQMFRDIDDARRALRRVDVAFIVLTLRGATFPERIKSLWRGLTTEPYSLETNILDRVLEVEREGGLDAFLKDAEEGPDTSSSA